MSYKHLLFTLYALMVVETPCSFDISINTTTSPYVRIQGIETTVLARKMPHTDPLCQKSYFQAFFSPHLTCPSDQKARDTTCCTLDNLRFCIDTAMENFFSSKMGVVVMANNVDEVLSINFKEAFQMTGLVGDVSVVVMQKNYASPLSHIGVEVHQLDLQEQVQQKLFNKTNICIFFQSIIDKLPMITKHLPKHAFILMIEDPKINNSKTVAELESSGFVAIASLKCRLWTMSLFCQANKDQRGTTHVVDVSEHVKFEWVEELKSTLEAAGPDDRVWVVSQQDPISGIIGMTKSLRMETHGEKVR